MKDRLFWTRLAFTACGLLRESEDKSQRRYWIDDFLPENAADTKHGVDVKGTAWVGDGPQSMHPYRFIVSVPQKILHRQRDSFSIECFALDAEKRTLQMEITNEMHGTCSGTAASARDEDEPVAEAMRRDAELDADPNIGISIEQLDAAARRRAPEQQ